MAEQPEGGDQPQGDSNPLPETIGFDYIKSHYFRVMFADGFIVGGTPSGLLHIEFFNQRAAIPKRVVHAVGPDGEVGKEIREQRDTRDAIVREVEGEIIMQVETAEQLIQTIASAVRKVRESLGRGNQ